MVESSGKVFAITGGTGFVGGHAIRTAIARGHRLRALARRAQPEMAGVEWIIGDLADEPALARLVAGADAIIHIAGVTNARTAADFHAGNVAGTEKLLAARGGQPLVHVSSLSAREPALSVYGASKLAGERLAAAADRVAIVRPPGVYGPGDREFLALFKAVSLGFVPLPAGTRASMLYGADLGEALVALAENLLADGDAAGGIYEIDDGAGGYAQPEIARAIAQATGARISTIPVPGAALQLGAAIDTTIARVLGRLPKLSFDRARYLAHRDWTADVSPLLALGIWQPRTSLAAGMRATALWYRAQGLIR